MMGLDDDDSNCRRLAVRRGVRMLASVLNVSSCRRGDRRCADMHMLAMLWNTKNYPVVSGITQAITVAGSGVLR